jgi:P27 family predicted phage terminase small subunit
MTRANLLSPWDLDTFAAYCAAVGFVRDAVELAAEEGIVLEQLVAERSDGTIVSQRITSPAFKAYRDAVATMRALAQEFGLTPSARATIKLDPPKADPKSAARELLS